MNYTELRSAVTDAYRQRDYARCFSLLDSFIEHSDGEDRGKALCFKASVILWIDPRRAPEGLSLVDEAMACCEDDPAHVMRSVNNALTLCYTLGDVHKARKYEALGTRLFNEHPTNAAVSGYRHMVHGNLGLLAGLRGEHASAFWHFMHAMSDLREMGANDSVEAQCQYLALSLYMVDSALQLGRVPEAEEALAQARSYAVTESGYVWWVLQRAKLLRYVGRTIDAAVAVDTVGPNAVQQCPPTEQVRYHVIKALLSQDQGEWPSYHRHVSLAQTIAVENALEYLLSEIQRIQRTPLQLGVMS